MKKIAVVCGGYSGEAGVSLKSAEMVMRHIDRTLYDPIKIIITKEQWSAEINGKEIPVNKNDFTVVDSHGINHRFDGAFIIVHGPPGENGQLQGYFDMIGMPYSTGDVLNMALTFNKKATTRTLGQIGFTVATSVVLKKDEPYSTSDVIESVGLPCFIKPNCGGSSIGTSKVKQAEELHLALDRAFAEDNQVIVEEYIAGTEVTCGVIVCNKKITALPITEIVSKNDFFDFAAKYQGASEEITPARIPDDMYLRVQQWSEDIFKKLECRGMIRVDFLIRKNEIFVVEVNTVPGFTEASIIPQQAKQMGLNYTELISTVIESTIE